MRRALLALLLVSTACSASASERTVTVFAAASLTKAFTAEAEAFERTHPGSRVRLSFAGSQSLVAQLQQGAPADVLATADLATIQRLGDELREEPVVFAHNQLAVITAAGNPRHVRSLADLARPGLRVVLAAPTVPVGRAAATALAAAGVTVRPLSLEDAVSGVVGKVRLGEADAGIAYATDRGPGLVAIPVPGTTTDLAIGSLTAAGEAFTAFVLGPEGRRVLQEHGFR